MSYAAAAIAINTDAVRQRVRVAIVAFALGVMAEVNTVNGHVLRVALAESVLGDPDSAAPRFAVAIIAQNQAAATDADIDGALAAIWNAMAGVAA